MTLFAILVLQVARRGTWSWPMIGLVALSAIFHRSALIWSVVLISAVLIHGLERRRHRRAAWGVYGVALGLMTLGANAVSVSAGLPVLQSGWSWTSSTFREAAAVALALLVWAPQASAEKATYIGIVAVGWFALWNPFLFSDSGFNTVGPRLALVAVWLLAVSGPIAVVESWRKGRRLLAVVVLAVLTLANSWPRNVETVSVDWIGRREVLATALASSHGEFEREGILLAEHGVQFLLRLAVDLDARQSVSDAERRNRPVWYWLTIDSQTPRFSKGNWIAPGWIQVPASAIDEWLKGASETEKVKLVTRNWHVRPLVRLGVPRTFGTEHRDR
jgi:hypothetical protein